MRGVLLHAPVDAYAANITLAFPGEATTQFAPTLDQVRKLVDNLDVGIKRYEAKGRPIGKFNQVIRDAKGEILGVESTYKY